jgi:hypothetical protein
MRKISRTRSRSQGGASGWSDHDDAPPPGIPGATVTAKPVDFDFDLSNLLLRSTAPATITGAQKPVSRAGSSTPTEDETKETVSLSDGTRITFVMAN